VGGGVVATAIDPGFALRGIMRMGTGSAEGVEDWEKGNKVVGGAKVAQEVLTAFTMVLGGVAASRAMSAPKNPGAPGGLANPANRAFYRQFEGAAAETLRGPLSDVATQVQVQPLVEAPPGQIGPQLGPARVSNVGGKLQVGMSGTDPLITITDAVERSKLTGKLGWEEAKSTNTAPLTSAQRLGNPLMAKNGGIIRAQNAGNVGLRAGQVVGPQAPVRVVRPGTLAARLRRPVAAAAAGTAVGTGAKAPPPRKEPRKPLPVAPRNAPLR